MWGGPGLLLKTNFFEKNKTNVNENYTAFDNSEEGSVNTKLTDEIKTYQINKLTNTNNSWIISFRCLPPFALELRRIYSKRPAIAPCSKYSSFDGKDMNKFKYIIHSKKFKTITTTAAEVNSSVFFLFFVLFISALVSLIIRF